MLFIKSRRFRALLILNNLNFKRSKGNEPDQYDCDGAKNEKGIALWYCPEPEQGIAYRPASKKPGIVKKPTANYNIKRGDGIVGGHCHKRAEVSQIEEYKGAYRGHRKNKDRQRVPYRKRRA